MSYRQTRSCGNHCHHKSFSDSEGTRELVDNSSQGSLRLAKGMVESEDQGLDLASLDSMQEAILPASSEIDQLLPPICPKAGNFAKSTGTSDSIPKAIIERSLRPERIDLKSHKRDIVELLAKFGPCQSDGIAPSLELAKSYSSSSKLHDYSPNFPFLKSNGMNGEETAKTADNDTSDQLHVNDSNGSGYGLNYFDSFTDNIYQEKNINYPVAPFLNNAESLEYSQNYYSNYNPVFQYSSCLSAYNSVSPPECVVPSSQRVGYFLPFTRVDITTVNNDANNSQSSKHSKNSSFTECIKNVVKLKHTRSCESSQLSNKNGSSDSYSKLVETALPREINFESGTTIELAKDQHGSRLIQQKIESSTPDEISSIINELTFDEKALVVLVGDVFGNYVVQKLLDHGDEEHRLVIINRIRGNVLFLTMQMYGCRVIQKAIECGSKAIQLVITKELENHVLDCIKDQNGNHVIQKCIEKINPSMMDFIITEIQGRVIELSSHPYGCRVIQRIMERFSDSQKSYITSELFNDIPSLVLDQYGNYVVQHILDHRKNHRLDREYIFQYVKSNLFRLSSHKFASNVVEKCLMSGTKQERRVIIKEIIDNSVGHEDDIVYKMMKDAYANYVIQKMIDVIVNDREYGMLSNLVSKIKPHYPNLRRINYGKHIINKIEKIYTKVATDPCTEEMGAATGVNIYYGLPDNCRNKTKVGKDHKSLNQKLVICDSLVEFPTLVGEAKFTLSSPTSE